MNNKVGTSAPNGSANGAQGGMPPHVRLLMLLDARRLSSVVYALAELGVADHLADGPRTVAELAELTGSHEESLYRLLRCAAGSDIFAEQPDGRFTLTPIADALRADAPNTQRDMILYNGQDMVSRPTDAIVYSVRTGQPSFDHIFDRSFFDYVNETPEVAEVFSRAMTQISQFSARALLAQLDLTGCRTVTDLGGGHGYFLREILRRYPEVHGTLVDTPKVAAGADAVLHEPDIIDRVTIAPGDFFTDIPADQDAYIIKAVLHDWDDEHAREILSGVSKALAAHPSSRLLLCEYVLADGNTYDHGKTLDIDMMVRLGGRERTLAEWQRLVGSVDLRVTNTPGVGKWTVIECRRTED